MIYYKRNKHDGALECTKENLVQKQKHQIIAIWGGIKSFPETSRISPTAVQASETKYSYKKAIRATTN